MLKAIVKGSRTASHSFKAPTKMNKMHVHARYDHFIEELNECSIYYNNLTAHTMSFLFKHFLFTHNLWN